MVCLFTLYSCTTLYLISFEWFNILPSTHKSLAFFYSHISMLSNHLEFEIHECFTISKNSHAHAHCPVYKVKKQQNVLITYNDHNRIVLIVNKWEKIPIHLFRFNTNMQNIFPMSWTCFFFFLNLTRAMLILAIKMMFVVILCLNGIQCHINQCSFARVGQTPKRDLRQIFDWCVWLKIWYKSCSLAAATTICAACTHNRRQLIDINN